MKQHFVKTSNYHLFLLMLATVESQAPLEGRSMYVHGGPGEGKTRTLDFIGAQRSAIYIEGMPGMTVAYLREFLAHRLGCPGGTRFTQEEAIKKAFFERVPMVIFDEAQFGLNKKSECLDYLRCVCEKAGSVLIMVTHTSEKHRFGEHKLAHISTRISAVVEFKPANLADCVLYLEELCEVSVDEEIAKKVLSQSGGRYRLMASACRMLEDIATGMDKPPTKGGPKPQLTGAEVKGMMLCENAMKSLRNGK